MSRKMTTRKFTITADIEIDESLISTDDIPALEKDILGQFIKVKSGLYENIACGWITKVDQTIPRKAR